MKISIKIAAVGIVALLVASFSFKSFKDEGNKEKLEWQKWNDGYTKVKAEGKIGLVDVYTDWCGWCKRMDRDTYAKKNIISKINKNFVPIKFNPEEQGVYYIDSTKYSGPQLYAMLSNNNPSGYPTTFFLIPKGGVMYVERVAGYQGAETFSNTLDQIVSFYEKPQQPSVPPTPAHNK